MNKFVLGIFVILAIGMADLPSTLGCNPDLVRPTTTPSPVTRKPKTGHGKPKGGKGIADILEFNDFYNAKQGRMAQIKAAEDNTRSVEARSNVFELEMEGFSICNTDGIEGLTFNEINACRVSHTILFYRLYQIIFVNLYFWILDPFGEFCIVSLAHSF